MPASSETSRPSILLVDDDPMVLATTKVTLECAKFRVTPCASPAAALELVAETNFDVIISDHKMPEMTGLALLAECSRLRPNTSRILLTAVLNPADAVDAIASGIVYRFIAKPWLRNELIATIRDAVERHRLMEENVALKAELARLRRLAAPAVPAQV
jgi:DNA-binding NtrC family response regulator